jgi:transposase
MMVVAAQSGQYPEAIARATKALQDGWDELVKLRTKALAWQQESELAEQRAHDLQASAEVARTRMLDMTPQKKAEVCDPLDLKVTMNGSVPKKVRADDTLIAWFRERGREVPVLDDAAWEKVRPIFEGADQRQRKNRLSHRKVLEAILLKASTGRCWPLGSSSRRWTTWRSAKVRRCRTCTPCLRCWWKARSTLGCSSEFRRHLRTRSRGRG